MKKIFVLFAVAFMLSCSNENVTNTQENIVNDTAKRPGSRCPAGTTEVWEYAFDGFNFHRPSKNCEEGFWFCFVGGEWNFVECKDTSGNIWTTPYDKMVIASVPENVGNTIDFYFPNHAFEGTNFPNGFEVFSVDDALVFGTHKLIVGEYPVQFNADYVKISVPTYEIE